jgi:hypothetical protein
MTSFARLVAAFSLSVVAAACTDTPAPPTAANTPPAAATDRARSTKLTLVFDGGYAFVREADGTITVDAIKSKSSHPMVLWLDKGTAIGATGPQPTTWTLTNSMLTLGANNAAVTLPATTEVPQPGACSPDPGTATEIDNQFYWPDLRAASGVAKIDDTPSKLESQMRLQGGAVKILRVAGCWEIRQGKRILRQPLVLGTKGLQFEVQLPSEEVRLAPQPFPGGSPSPEIRVKQDAAGEVRLFVRHRQPKHPEPPSVFAANAIVALDDRLKKKDVEGPIGDFDRYNVLLGLSGARRLSLFMHRRPPAADPGDECVPAFMTRSR